MRFINYSPKTPLFDATKYNLTSVLPSNNAIYMNVRSFQNVGHYHNVADESLNSIQDAVEDFFEDHYDADTAEKEEDIPEVNYSSGVLTIYLPPHGTWVVNKQTPNEQIWWSSPLSGPRRYEYDDERERWVYSRVADEGGAADVELLSFGELLETLGISRHAESLAEEHITSATDLQLLSKEDCKELGFSIGERNRVSECALPLPF